LNASGASVITVNRANQSDLARFFSERGAKFFSPPLCFPKDYPNEIFFRYPFKKYLTNKHIFAAPKI
jgi:hypothetical protein